MTKLNILQSLLKTYDKLSNWGKILMLVLFLLIIIILFKSFDSIQEGFDQDADFIIKENDEILDDFYVNIYDQLLFSTIKNDFEISEIIHITKPVKMINPIEETKPTVAMEPALPISIKNPSKILDVGSCTGHTVGGFKKRDYNIVGIDNCELMVKKAQQNYPKYKNLFMNGDVRDVLLFQPNSFTHILCLYFTIYYIKDKKLFFNNCMNWLNPGGYLIVHLVDRNQFDPILPPGNPLITVSPQRYAKNRITNTDITFNNFTYSSNFELNRDTNIALFNEKMKANNGKVRKNQLELYMNTHEKILLQAQNMGFNIIGKVDMVKCEYEYQYLYILQKPK
jgi:SAM-dependent methyltransferase